MVLEFVGLPGSGKTTIACKFVEGLQERNASVCFRAIALSDSRSAIIRHLVRGWFIVRRVFAERRAYWSLVRLVVRSSQDRKLNLLKMVWNGWTVLALISVCRRQGKVLVSDQGIGQMLWSIGFSASRPLDWELVQKIFNYIRCEDFVFVIVNVESGIAMERLGSREGSDSRMEDARVLNDNEQWRRAESMVQEVAERIRELVPGGVFVEVDANGEKSPETLANEILLAHEKLEKGNRGS